MVNLLDILGMAGQDPTQQDPMREAESVLNLGEEEALKSLLKTSTDPEEIQQALYILDPEGERRRQQPVPYPKRVPSPQKKTPRQLGEVFGGDWFAPHRKFVSKEVVKESPMSKILMELGESEILWGKKDVPISALLPEKVSGVTSQTALTPEQRELLSGTEERSGKSYLRQALERLGPVGPSAPEKPTEKELDKQGTVDHEVDTKFEHDPRLGYFKNLSNKIAEQAKKVGKDPLDVVSEHFGPSLGVRKEDIDEEITQLTRRLRDALDRKPGLPELLMAFSLAITGRDGVGFIRSLNQEHLERAKTIGALLQSARGERGRQEGLLASMMGQDFTLRSKTAKTQQTAKIGILKAQRTQINSELSSVKSRLSYWDLPEKERDKLESRREDLEGFLRENTVEIQNQLGAGAGLSIKKKKSGK